MKLAALAWLLPLAAAAASPATGPVTGAQSPAVEAYFTPGDDVAKVIADRIGTARRSVQVEAYLFTSRRIAAALAKAARRGVAVEVIGDAEQFEGGGLPVLRELERAGARTYLRSGLAAFHHKIIIVDGVSPAACVITGSFNFTQAAQAKNAENIVVICGDRALATRFVRDFERHRDASSRLQ